MIALFIILGILLLLFLISLIKIEIFITYQDSVTLVLKILFVKLKLVSPDKEKKPKKKKKEKSKKKVPKKEETEEKEKKQSLLSSLKEKHGLPGLLSLFNDLVKIATGAFKGILKKLVFKRFDLMLEIVGEDAAQTALTYGKVCSIVYPAVTLTAGITDFKDYSLVIKPRFDSEKTNIYLNVYCYERVMFIVHYALVAGVKVLFKYLKYRRK